MADHLNVQYSPDCPIPDERSHTTEETKYYWLSVDSIPTNGLDKAFDIIKFIAPGNKKYDWSSYYPVAIVNLKIFLNL